jgi:hypothetical protein
MGDFDERVRQRAYRLWVEEGCPEGRADAHWDKARELVATEQNQKQTTKPVTRDAKEGREPVEPASTMKNLGEFPTLTDQGEGKVAPERSAGASKAAPRPAPKAAPARKAPPRAAAARQSKAKPKDASPKPH